MSEQSPDLFNSSPLPPLTPDDPEPEWTDFPQAQPLEVFEYIDTESEDSKVEEQPGPSVVVKEPGPSVVVEQQPGPSVKTRKRQPSSSSDLDFGSSESDRPKLPRRERKRRPAIIVGPRAPPASSKMVENTRTPYSGRVISTVPGYPDWCNTVFDNDESVYVYKLAEDYAAGDLEIVVEDLVEPPNKRSRPEEVDRPHCSSQE